MKKWKKIFALAVFALAVTLAAKSNTAAAAQITGVKQTDASTGSVKISWDAALASERYVVEVSDDMKNWYPKEDTSSTETRLAGLTAGKTYYVRVTGYKDWSIVLDKGILVNEASIPVDVVTVPEVKNISVAQSEAFTNSFSVKFSGAEDSGANFYQVYLNDTVVGESDSPVISVSGSFLPGSKYWCETYACRRSSSGFVAKGSAVYSYYKTLSEKLGINSFHISNMLWNINVAYFDVVNSNDVDGYQMQFLNAAGKEKKTFTQTSPDFRVENFMLGTFYQYRARTFVECGSEKVYSEWSGCRYIGIPKKVAVKKGSSLKINWGKVSGASKFVVKVSTSQNSGYKTVKTVSADKRSVTVKKFKNKKIQKTKRYYIRIYAQAVVGGKTVTTELPWEGSC
ncbi:hypothetical protein D7V86_18845 [bacterium D16-51]|nr:hypothetical protein D7V96_05425 [bacterium D16-59]RKI56926.1 hypothetical protein D7V86_18845 [bacterium D16-51]